jgi:hypothetical protein
MLSLLIQLAAFLLGLLTGAMLLIGVSLVPYWSSLEPLEFSRWFAAHSGLIGRLMVPLGGLATVTIVLAAGLAAVRRLPGRHWLALSAVSTLFIAAIYPLYYTTANAALGSGTLAPGEITVGLARWRAWHWARIIAGAVAFLAAIRACSLQARVPYANKPSGGR